MTDLELNKAIANALDYEVIEWYSGLFITNPDGTQSGFDYLKNWNDLMPLVIKHEIDLIYQNGNKYKVGCWKALAFHYYSDGEFHDDVEVFDENPQRALAECLLKVLTTK